MITINLKRMCNMLKYAAYLLAFISLFNIAAADVPKTKKLSALKKIIKEKMKEPRKFVNSGGGKCLDAPEPGKNGGRVQIWDCNNSPNQQWQFVGGAIADSAGKCLNAANPHKSGERLEIRDCNNSSNQKWTLSKGRLINGGGKCLNVPAPHQNGGQVQIWDCNNAPNQQWSIKK